MLIFIKSGTKLQLFLRISKFFCIFVADFMRNGMKTRISVIAMLFFAFGLQAQVHISLPESGNWSGQLLAPYVGQTVVFDMPMIVCTNANGNYTVSPWRRFEPLCQGVPGSEEYNETIRINSTCMFSLSGVSGYHRCGEKIYNLTAKVNSTSSLSMSNGTWKGNKRADLEAGLPDLGDYRLLVCGFNLENYYMTWGSMGADSYAEHQYQRAKISAALKKINADIFGLVELQQGDEAVAEIVSDLNKNLPGRNYCYFHDAGTGTFQKVDYVYDANTVEPINTPAETNVETQNRKKMICFREKATGEKFIYSINHFKAMNTGDADRRANEAQAVVKLYNSYRQNRSIQENDILIMGDLNCYAKTDPIFVFTESNKMLDLHRTFHADSSYSYMYSGMASYIDHAICNETLYRQITGMAAYHINSDEDDKYTYDKSSDRTMFRCSDHDPVLVGLKLDSTHSQPIVPFVNGLDVLQRKDNKIVIQNAYDAGLKSFYAIYTINGLLQERKEITSSYHVVDLPTAPGVYIIYLYYKGEAYPQRLIVR